MVWEEKADCLSSTFKFKDFKAAFSFMTEVADEAERQNHHPDWTNVYNRVSFRLNTHDAGGKVTEKDRRLAVAISQIYNKCKTV